MALSPRLELKLSQSLVMTPQLQQAIKLLQYSNIDLVNFVTEELEKNPLLERGDTRENPSENDAQRQKNNDNPVTEAAQPSADDYLKQDPITASANDAPLDTNFDNDFNNDSPTDNAPSQASGDLGVNAKSMMGGGGSFDQPGDSLDQRLSDEISLQDELLNQLNMLSCSVQDKIIIQYLIGALDESGYLCEEVEAIAEHFGTDVHEIEAALSIAQAFEPVGVFARDLSECLKLQQRENDRLDPAMCLLLDNLDILAKRDYNKLMRICKVDAEDLKDMVSEIQALNPKPGMAFGGSVVQTVIPDVYIRKSPKGTWLVELNNDTLPKVLLNNSYFSEVKKITTQKKDKEYLADCMASANWLVKALDQRARTILKVSSELVKHQADFFEKGIKYLKPLNLRTIAEAIEMHESTVSRVTANKYIATNRGTFEMKYFFTTAIASMNSEQGHSSEAVKHQIRTLIDNEDPKKILSDDKLVITLKSEGIDIARRTVAKYREAMNISSSIQRRREKNSRL